MEGNSILPELTDAQFARICRLLYQHCGISLREGKEALVRSRLSRRLNRLGITSYDGYVDLVEQEGSGEELRAMIDALTTNKTSFFREPQHFAFLQNQLLPQWLAMGEALRFWSAGCSTGEEPYTLAIVLQEALASSKSRDCRVLATDISERVLGEARRGVYRMDRLEDVPAEYLRKYFSRAGNETSPTYAVGDKLRSIVRFARLNLMESWPMKGPFNAIFCRNVMIYFELPTRKALVQRFTQLLRPGGYLFVGHSESLTQSSTELAYVQPAIYVKRP